MKIGKTKRPDPNQYYLRVGVWMNGWIRSLSYSMHNWQEGVLKFCELVEDEARQHRAKWSTKGGLPFSREDEDDPGQIHISFVYSPGLKKEEFGTIPRHVCLNFDVATGRVMTSSSFDCRIVYKPKRRKRCHKVIWSSGVGILNGLRKLAEGKAYALRIQGGIVDAYLWVPKTSKEPELRAAWKERPNWPKKGSPRTISTAAQI